MKSIFLFCFAIGFIKNVFAQNNYQDFVKKFYTKIDSTKQLKCCDSTHHGFSLIYEVPLIELPYDKIDFEDYEQRNSEDIFIDSHIIDLIDAYYKIDPSIRKQITRSCYNQTVDYKISKNLTGDGFYWIEGTLKIKVSFQSDDVDFCLPWWKKFWCKLTL